MLIYHLRIINIVRFITMGFRFKRIYLIVASFICMGCSKYQVVSEVQLNLYHLHNPKTKSIEVVLTKDKLVIGEYYKLKDINIIDSPYYKKK